MNLIWLEDFLALAASGNFSRAAEERASSQPAFSRRIRGLEEWIGVDLFDRSSQPATLTEAGEWVHGVAEDLLARVARLPAVEATAPLGQVQLMSDVLARCEALMLQGKVQFVLSHAHARAPGALDVDDCRATRIGQDVLVPLAQPDAAGRPRHALSDGAPAAVLQYSDESGLGRILRAVLGRRLGRRPG